MRSALVLAACVSFGLALAPLAHSQVLASSADYKLAAYGLDSSGGGTSSFNYSTWVSLADLSSGLMSGAHTNAQSKLGFMETNDPQPSNVPIVFGEMPNFGPKAGGTSLTLSGMNFDKLGTGPLVTVQIGGNLASSTVLSNTQISVTSPPGLSGPRSVTVTNPFGTFLDPDGFIYTPAVTTTAIAPLGSNLVIRNYGPVGNTYRTLVSSSTTAASTKFGILLIGPTPLIELLGPSPYPGPDGVSTVSLLVPNMPALHGLTVHFQSLSISNPSPLAGSLTNSSPTTIP